MRSIQGGVPPSGVNLDLMMMTMKSCLNSPDGCKDFSLLKKYYNLKNSNNDHQ